MPVPATVPFSRLWEVVVLELLTAPVLFLSTRAWLRPFDHLQRDLGESRPDEAEPLRRRPRHVEDATRLSRSAVVELGSGHRASDQGDDDEQDRSADTTARYVADDGGGIEAAA